MVMVPRPRATRPSFSKYLSMRDTTSLAVPRFLAICSWVVEITSEPSLTYSSVR